MDSRDRGWLDTSSKCLKASCDGTGVRIGVFQSCPWPMDLNPTCKCCTSREVAGSFSPSTSSSHPMALIVRSSPRASWLILYESSRTSNCERYTNAPQGWKMDPLTMFLPSYMVASLIPQPVQACIFFESLRSLPEVPTGHTHHRSSLHAPDRSQ